jgi:hypothetical protein
MDGKFIRTARRLGIATFFYAIAEAHIKAVYFLTSQKVVLVCGELEA